MTQTVVAQQDFTYGISRDAAPHEVDTRAVTDHINGFYERAGSVVKRGGTANLSGSALGSTGLTFLRDDHFDAGWRTLFANASDFAVLDSDDSTVVNLGSEGLPYPKPAALIEGMLFIGGGYIYAGSRKSADYTTGTISVTAGSKTVTGSGTTWNTLTDAGMLLQIGNQRVYAVASIDSTTSLTLRDAFEGSTGAGNNYTLSPIYKITAADPYPDSEFYSVCANRLVYSTDGRNLGFSEIQSPHDQTATIGGASIPNEHPIPEGQIICTSTVGLTTLAYTTVGTWALEGLAFDITDDQGNPQHRLQHVSRETTLWAPTGLANWQQAAVVPALDGIYIMDGVSRPERISYGIDSVYRHYISQNYRAGQADVYRGHYFLPILNATGTEIRDVLVARLDRAVRSDGQVVFPWSRLRDAGGAISAYAVRSQADNNPRLLGAEIQASSRIVDCSDYFEPTADNAYDADGSKFSWVLVTRDYETGNLTTNKVRRTRTRYELTALPTDQIDYSGSWAMVPQAATSADADAGLWAVDQAQPTELYINEVDWNFTDQSHRGLLGMAAHGTITMRAEDEEFIFEIIGTPTDNGDRWTVPVNAPGVDFTELWSGFPSVPPAQSLFDTESGDITGDALLSGGTWQGSGDSDDFSVAAGVATRTAVSDTAGLQNGRLIRASSTAGASTTTLQLDFKQSASPAVARQGALLRFTDTDNYLAIYSDGTTVSVVKRVAGVNTTLDSFALTQTPDVWYRLTTVLSVRGTGTLNLVNLSTLDTHFLFLEDSSLEAGGALAEGSVGIVDHQSSATANTRSYDNFYVNADPSPLLSELLFYPPYDGPVVRFAYGFGRKEEGGYVWDAYNWDDLDADDTDSDLVWETEDDETFHHLSCTGLPDDGTNPKRCRVNKDARFMRFRLSQDDPCAVMRLRSFEMFVRPSQAERR